MTAQAFVPTPERYAALKTIQCNISRVRVEIEMQRRAAGTIGYASATAWLICELALRELAQELRDLT